MKNLFTVCCCLVFLSATYSQSYTVTNLRVSNYSHNHECGTDGFFSNTDPEPNYIIRWRVSGGSYGASTVIRPGAPTQACGSYSTSKSLSPSSYSGTNNTLEFEIESWEDDNCGNVDTYDDNCANDDDNHSFEVKSITLTSGVTSNFFTLNNSVNNYTITISYDLTVLPIKLSSFDGTLTERGILLRWQTEQESNSFEFEVEKSEDGRYFETIEVLDAAGDSKQTLQYKTLDAKVLDFAYYRLKMVDLDGSIEYSKTIRIVGNKTASLMLKKLYPNPSKGELNLQFQVKDIATPIELRITDINGKLMKSKTIFAQSSSFTTRLDVTSLNSGQYILTAINKDQLVSQRFIVN